MTKLIIDADTGSDDAVALLMAYRNLPEDKILGITVVAGNVPLEQGLINTSYVNELCEVQIPIYKGAEKPLERNYICLLYTSPSPRDPTSSRMPSSA